MKLRDNTQKQLIGRKIKAFYYEKNVTFVPNKSIINNENNILS